MEKFNSNFAIVAASGQPRSNFLFLFQYQFLHLFCGSISNVNYSLSVKIFHIMIIATKYTSFTTFACDFVLDIYIASYYSCDYGVIWIENL